MKPRRKYEGEETHKIAIEEQHRKFVSVRRHLKKVKTRQAKYADQRSKQIDYEVGAPVYYKNQRMQNKLDARRKKVQVGKDQEKRNQKKTPTPKTEAGKNKLTIRYLYHENIS